MEKKIFLFTIIIEFVFLLSLISAWTFSGTIYDVNGNLLNDTNVTITSIYAPGGVPPTFGSVNTTQSNATGFFNLSSNSNNSLAYLVTLRHFNSTTNKSDFVGQSLPYFPDQIFSSNINTNFYLKPSGTLNITAVNSSGGRTNFSYQIKDTQLGYTVDNNWNSGSAGTSEATIYLPSDKNYSIMIYPLNNMPLSFTWNNFSSANTIRVGNHSLGTNISYYNATTKVLYKQFNTTTSMTQISGYINGSSIGITGWDNFTVIPMILEAGRYIFLQHSAMPYNMGSWGGLSDFYNLTTGYYNITIPGPVETQTILLYVAAKNGSNYYGTYQNISLSYQQSNQYNLTMYGLLGNYMKNISMGSGQGATNILTKMMTLNLVNATDNQTLNMPTETHVEVVLDYSSIGLSEFVITDAVASGSSAFYLPMLNISGSKEINVFSNNFAPRRLATKTSAQLNANNNISLSNFNPQTRDGRSGSQIDMVMITSNVTCDVPSPSFSCYKGSPNENMASFNPMTAIIGGGKISFRMSYGNISVHYANVDMLASGPPDAVFDSNRTDRISNSFEAVMKFGSQGPKIYDYILVSMPYDENRLREFQPVNISIPLLYDEDWNVIWNVSANGTNPSALSGNYSHYSGRENEWGNLTISKTCTTGVLTNANQINETNPCYIDTNRNKIWIRIPHFSGTEPSILGGSTTDRYIDNARVGFLTPTPDNNTFVGNSYFTINVTSNLSDFSNMTVYFYNVTAINLTNFSTNPTVWWVISNISDGIYFYNASAMNSSGFTNRTETRRIVIDTTNPTINLTSPVGANNMIINLNVLNITANVTDTNLANVTIYLYNSSLAVINSSLNTTSTSGIGAFVNFTLSYLDGLYYFNATGCDNASRCNNSELRSVILNGTLPEINASSVSVTSSGATITVTANKTVNLTISYGTTANFGTNQSSNSFVLYPSLSLSGLSASTTYYYNITICDRAGNCAVNGTYSFTTPATTTTTTTSGGGDASGYWYSTSYPTATRLSEGYTEANMIARTRIQFKVGTETHNLGLISVSSDSVVINVSSTPQQATLKIGETKKFEVTGDNVYDVQATLNSITGSKASITIKTIAEQMTAGTSDTGTETTSTTGTGTTTSTTGTSKAGISKTMWIVLIIVLIIIAVLIIYYFLRKKDY